MSKSLTESLFFFFLYEIEFGLLTVADKAMRYLTFPAFLASSSAFPFCTDKSSDWPSPRCVIEFHASMALQRLRTLPSHPLPFFAY